MKRVLVAGIGNIFLRDDAFGVEVARRLAVEHLPPGVSVRDFGIRSLHLAYELLDVAYDLTVLIDASPRGGRPGTLYVIEPHFENAGPLVPADAHSMNPDTLFATLRVLGGTPGRVLVVGCEPASVEEGMGLGAECTAAIDEAVRLVKDLLARECAEGESHVSGDPRPDRAITS